MESARSKAEMADQAAAKAKADGDRAKLIAKEVEQRERFGVDPRIRDRGDKQFCEAILHSVEKCP